MVDPDGQWPVYFYLYSERGTLLPDTAERQRWEIMPYSLDHVTLMVKAAQASRLPIVATSLEGDVKMKLPDGAEMKHLTVSAHGEPGSISSPYPWYSDGSQDGAGFASTLYEGSKSRFGEDAIHSLESVALMNCNASCIVSGYGGKDESFASSFAQRAGELFPRLKHVIASPYDLGHVPPYEERELQTVRLSVFPLDAESSDDNLFRYMPADKFFRGDFPKSLFGRPRPEKFNGIFRANVFEGGQFIEDQISYSRESVRGFFVDHQDSMHKPIFGKISIPRIEE